MKTQRLARLLSVLMCMVLLAGHAAAAQVTLTPPPRRETMRK